jgi:hypothetical protein
MVENLDDILEEIADNLGIYNEQRSEYIYDLKCRIKKAIQLEFIQGLPCQCTDDWTDGTTYCQQCGRERIK